MLNALNLRKTYPGVVALDGVSIELRAGEVHALMGGNGAGKSTVIKVLNGAERADSGEIQLDGALIAPRSPLEAARLGIATVHQELGLVATMSVAENIVLGRRDARPARGLGRLLGFSSRDAVRRAAAALRPFGLSGEQIDLRAPVGALSMALRQIVAIARAVDARARVVIFDEATSSLDRAEVDRLFSAIRPLKERGAAILYVTHALDELPRLADRVTVLRDGRRVGCWISAELSREALVHAMLGEVSAASAVERTTAPSSTAAAPLLTARRVGRRGTLAPIDLALSRSETVGLAGLLGSGRTELLRLLFGDLRADSGEVAIGGAMQRRWSPRRAVAHGVGLSPEDRNREGLVLELTARENILLGARRRTWAMNQRATQRRVESVALRVGLDPAALDRPIRTLSGGTRQKVLLARLIAANATVLLLDEPCRGIDLGAKAQIERLVALLRHDGCAVLLAAGEIDELARQCDRVLVLRDRTLVAELPQRPSEGALSAPMTPQAIRDAIATESP